MTRVYVDEREITLPSSSYESLDGIVKHIEGHLLPPNIVIRRIQLDGIPLLPQDASEPGAPLQTSVAAREKIEIFTGTLGEIARDSIRETQSYLERVEAVIPSIVTSFRMSPGPEAFGQLKQLLDGFYWMNLLRDRIGAAFGSPSEIPPDGGATDKDCLLRFALVLSHLVEAQEKHDFSLIADLLEFEIIPTIPEWKALFAALYEVTGKER